MGKLLSNLKVKARSYSIRLKKLASDSWDESKYKRGKTTPGSRGGSFAPKRHPIVVSDDDGSRRVLPVSGDTTPDEDFSVSPAFKGNSSSGRWSDRSEGFGAAFKDRSDRSQVRYQAERALKDMGFIRGQGSARDRGTGPYAETISTVPFTHPSGASATLEISSSGWNHGGKASLVFKAKGG